MEHQFKHVREVGKMGTCPGDLKGMTTKAVDAQMHVCVCVGSWGGCKRERERERE